MNLQLIRNLNSLLCNACAKYEFYFVDNGSVFECDFCKDGIHLLEFSNVISVKMSFTCWSFQM